MKKLMTHLYYGDISPEYSQDLAIKLVESGADLLEIGIPYSDPVSDGPVFQKACRDALKNGVTPVSALKGIRRIRKKTNKPIYLTSYFGPIYKTGIEKILGMAKDAGVNGLIIPDLPFEEQKYYKETFDKFGIPVIQFATVYSIEARIKIIIKESEDFIYCVSLPGVTGDKMEFIKLEKFLKFIKSVTDKKIYCGFGIKSDADAGKIINLGADGVIVGSAIAEIYQLTENLENALDEIQNFIINIKRAIV